MLKTFFDVDCNCNVNGSSSLSCNSNGTCPCKDNVIGEKCTECTPGFFGFPDCTGKNFIHNGSFQELTLKTFF